jgi:hypothetical protein
VQMLEFYPAGTAEVMLTDIINEATYEIQKDRIVVKVQSGGDAPAEMIFLSDLTLRNIILQGTTSVWELEQFQED